MQQAAPRPAPIASAVAQERVEAIVAWGMALAIFLFAPMCLARYGHNIPLSEDWALVAPVTGNEPVVPATL
jgi:hypothetical protein